MAIAATGIVANENVNLRYSRATIFHHTLCFPSDVSVDTDLLAHVLYRERSWGKISIVIHVVIALCI